MLPVSICSDAFTGTFFCLLVSYGTHTSALPRCWTEPQVLALVICRLLWCMILFVKKWHVFKNLCCQGESSKESWQNSPVLPELKSLLNFRSYLLLQKVFSYIATPQIRQVSLLFSLTFSLSNDLFVWFVLHLHTSLSFIRKTNVWSICCTQNIRIQRTKNNSPFNTRVEKHKF